MGRLHLGHLDGGDAERPHVSQARVGAFSDHLGRHPQRRAHRGRAQRQGALQLDRHAKVG